MDFEAQSTEGSSRESYTAKEEEIAAQKKSIAEAVAAGDYDKVAELAKQAKALEGAKDEMLGSAQEDANDMNKAIGESKAAEAAAIEKARIAEEGRQQAEADAARAAKLLGQIKDGNFEGGTGVAEVVQEGSVVENAENTGEEVGTIVNTMKKQGYYKEAFSALKPGEQPSPELATKMICTLIQSSDAEFNDYAKVLMDKLSFDGESVKKFVVKEVMDGKGINEKDLRMMKVADIDPASLHDDAVKELDSLLNLVTRRDGAVRSVGDVVQWKETFGISEDEYAEALRKLYEKRGRDIGDDNMRALGFVKEKNGRTLWAWEKL